MAVYSYRPLKLPAETRVLTIAPGEFSEPIQCSLTNIPIDSDAAVPYEALSYCWSKSLTNEPPGPSTEVQCAVYDPTGKQTEKRSLQFQELIRYPNYEHLYYQAGGPRLPGHVTCDGVEMTIGGELYSALKRLRKQDEPLRIWVDALCINQSEVDERNEHIKMMSEIYSKASAVHIWLGEQLGDEERAVQTMKRVWAKFDALFPNGLSDPLAHVNLAAEFVNDKTIQNLDWDALAALMSRAWFERVWVIQEIVNASAAWVHIGNCTLSWEWLSSIITGLRGLHVDMELRLNNGVKSVCDMVALRRGRMNADEQWPLLNMLEETRAFKSTLASDKIYGILGLAPKSDRELVDVDYSIDAAETFRRFAVACLTKGRYLDILSHCVHPQGLDLPSWVPDWTRRGYVEPFRIRRLQCSAAGDTRPQFRIDESGKMLYTSGKTVDKIAVIEELRPIPTEFDHMKHKNKDHIFLHPETMFTARMTRFKQSAKAWYRNIFDIAFPEGKATQVTFENLWRTCMCNRTRDNEVPNSNCAIGFDVFMSAMVDEKTPEAVLQERRDRALANATTEGDLDNDNIFEQMPNFVTEIFAEKTFTGAHSKWCYSRRFFRSEAGRFGWTVHGSQPGDEIGIFYGGDYPFVLRPDSSGKHRIIGNCYIHGLMDGEALDESLPAHEFCIV